MDNLPPLRPDQEAFYSDLATARMDGSRTMLGQVPCGAGKSIIIMTMGAKALAKRRRVAVVTNRNTIKNQFVKCYVDFGGCISRLNVMQADHPWQRDDADFHIVSVHTLKQRVRKKGKEVRPKCDLVLIDEAHIRSTAVDDWINDPEEANTTFIGFSATPWAQGLGLLYGRLVKGLSTQKMIDEGLLVPFTVFAPAASQPDVRGVKIDRKSGDYREGDLEERCNKATIVADIVANWVERGENRPTACFPVNVAHGKHIVEQFASVGVRAALVHANTCEDEREAIFAGVRSGDIKIVVSVGCLSEGFDLPAISCVILARPTKSTMLYQQQLGRGLRLSKETGKSDCLVFDHGDNSGRLGLITDPGFDRDELDSSEKGRGEAKRSPKEKAPALPKHCKKCDAVNPAHLAECHACGTPFPVKTSVTVADGELVQVSGKKSRGEQSTVAERIRAMGKQSTWSQLKGIEIESRKRKGWAFHRWCELWGQKRPGPDVKQHLVERPTMEVASWARSRDIAWHKARGSFSVGAGAGYAL